MRAAVVGCARAVLSEKIDASLPTQVAKQGWAILVFGAMPHATPLHATNEPLPVRHIVSSLLCGAMQESTTKQLEI